MYLQSLLIMIVFVSENFIVYTRDVYTSVQVSWDTFIYNIQYLSWIIVYILYNTI